MPTLKQNEAANYRAFWALERRTERAVRRNYRQALDTIRSDLTAIFDKYAKGGKLTYAEMTKYNRLNTMHAQIINDMGPLFTENGKSIERLATDVYEQSYFREAWAIDQDTGVDLRWGRLRPETVTAAVQNPISGLSLHGLTLEQRRRTLMGINRTVTQGIVQGESYAQMARRAKDFLAGDYNRALTVVRTEGQRAATAGQIAAYDRAEELGMEVNRVWVAILDAVTRPEHAALDGESAGDDGMFDTAVGPVAGPSQSGDPSFDINCRCRIVSRVRPPKERRIRDEGIVEYQTYRQWVRDKPELKRKLDQVAKRAS